MISVRKAASLLLSLILICILFTCSIKTGKIMVSPEVIVNRASINSTGDQVIIEYTLPTDFYSDPKAGKYLYIGFKYPDEFRGAFENKYVPISQKSGTYTAILPYAKGLSCGVSVVTRYQTAWGRGFDEYVRKGIIEAFM